MLLHILKNDLKNKRVTNAILLLFISLAAMFVSSSVNNIFTIVTAQDDYFEMANMPDYIVLTRDPDGECALAKAANNFNYCKKLETEQILFMTQEQFDGANNHADKIKNVIMISAMEYSAMNYFGEDNKPLPVPKKGEMYLSHSTLDTGVFSIGDSVTATVGGKSVVLTVKGVAKDALWGSPFVGAEKLLISAEDYNTLASDTDANMYKGNILYFTSDDIDGLISEVSDTGIHTMTSADRAMLKMVNILDLIIAMIIFLVSVCMIWISFVVLKFTINFTLEQEFREVGVMKAIGIPDRRIGGIYLTKYFFIAIIGSAIGFFAGIPFGNFLMKNTAANTVIESKNPYGINLICSALVMLVVLLYCRRCTRTVSKYTPVDAVQSGNNGETYSKKSKLSLARKIRPIISLSLNDILSNVKQYAVMGLTFTLSLILMIVIVNTVNTLRSGNLVTWMGMTRSELYFNNPGEISGWMNENGKEIKSQRLREISHILEKNGIDARVYSETAYYLNFSNGENTYSFYTLQGLGTTTDEYDYLEGTAPQNINEIAITPQVAKVLNVSIGDTVIMNCGGKDKEMLVTAYFQTMISMGSTVRIHEDVDISYALSSGGMGIQVKYSDNLSEREIEAEREKIAKLLPEYQVMNGGEFIDDFINVSGTIDGVRRILVPILLIICVMVTVLMERSFIAKEKGEIAMMKAIGFSNGFICRQHLLRVSVVMLVSAVIAILLSTPASQLISGFAFKIMGAQNIVFCVRPLEVFVFYPLMALGLTLFAVFITSLGTRKITANQTAGIE